VVGGKEARRVRHFLRPWCDLFHFNLRLGWRRAGNLRANSWLVSEERSFEWGQRTSCED
jgi:hypothetical protein